MKTRHFTETFFQQPAALELPRNEWDFSSKQVKNDHLRACVEWEYHRSIIPYRDAVIRYREALKRHARRIGTDTAEIEHSTLLHPPMHHRFTRWPNTPFATLSPREQEAFKHEADRFIRGVESQVALPLSDSLSADEWKVIANMAGANKRPSVPSMRQLPNSSEVALQPERLQLAALRIDWSFRDKKLLECFRAWLRRNRPKNVRAKDGRGGGNTFRQLRKELKELGTWRLLQVMSWEAAFVYTKEVLQGEGVSDRALYGSNPALWFAAHKRAGNKLEALRATLFL